VSTLTSRERLQPSLLDRLTDDDPGNPDDGPDRRGLSLTQLKASVLRDLAWLLNAISLLDAEATRQTPAGTSVINYGLPPLAGHCVSNIDVQALEGFIHQAITAYEPRVVPGSLRVQAQARDHHMNVNALSFEIQADVWAQPVALPLLLRTELDLESGHMRVVPLGQRRRA
jgi:type VI secretion system protein ImpF